jgi:hypothetical protein
MAGISGRFNSCCISCRGIPFWPTKWLTPTLILPRNALAPQICSNSPNLYRTASSVSWVLFINKNVLSQSLTNYFSMDVKE